MLKEIRRPENTEKSFVSITFHRSSKDSERVDGMYIFHDEQ